MLFQLSGDFPRNDSIKEWIRLQLFKGSASEVGYVPPLYEPCETRVLIVGITGNLYPQAELDK